MKKMKMFALMLLAGAALLTSCGKDEPSSPAPTISFTNNETSKVLDFSSVATIDVTFNVTVSAEGEISTFTAKKKVNGTSTNITPAPADFSGKTSYTYNYTGTFLATDTYPVELIFTVTDKEDQSTEKIFTITKAGASGTALAYENTSSLIYNLMAPTGYLGAWDLANNVGVASSGTETSKDMANKSTAGTGWIAGWSTGTGNTTAFVKDNALVYASATLEDITASYAAGTSSTTITPAVGDIYVAKLRGGSNYALIKVTAINTTASDNLDNITFTYKKLTSTSGQ